MNSTTRIIAVSSIVSATISSLVVGGATRMLSIAPSGEAQVPRQEQVLMGGSAREETIVNTVRAAEPAVVSVMISKNLPVLERYYDEGPSTGNPLFDQFFSPVPRGRENGTQLRQVGGGTAFFVSPDGLLMTNKHVVSDDKATYTVLFNDGKTMEARVIGRDPVNDIALLKVDGNDFPYLKISEVTSPVLGQTVIAIGNSLGEFSNTVSVGVISGLQRDIVAGDRSMGQIERLSRILQTDAAINEGNSGGPLISSNGEVIGMSTAVATGAQNIGFAIPAQDLKRVLGSYEKYGRIVRPYIGVRYSTITEDMAQDENLSVTDGALVAGGDGDEEPAVAKGSPAEKAGIRENDIIISIDGVRLTEDMTVADIIQGKLPGDEVTLRVLRDGKELTLRLTLDEWKAS